MPGPAWVGAPGHCLPQARDALREAIEGRAEADLLHEDERAPLAADTERPAAPEAAVTQALEDLGPRGHAQVVAQVGEIPGAAPG